MALSLEQYAAYLDTRDLPWPAPPEAEPARAKAHIKPLPEIRAVLWNVYGTFLSLPGGELWFEHPKQFVMDVALDKMVQEFKMWGSMSRKPGQPAEYLGQMYGKVLAEQRTVPGGGERYPEVLSERVWEAIIKKLLQKDYQFDAGFFGALNELSQKVAYFFHASLQGTACYDGAAAALRSVKAAGLAQGLLADGQCFTHVQLQRALSRQDESAKLDDLLDADLCVLSCDVRGKKPSERLFKQALASLGQRGIAPGQVLHVGSRMQQDIVAARRNGMRTALFAGDRGSLQATTEQLKDRSTRPDVLLTELRQIGDVVGASAARDS
jgi:FMN phosphatase YigB (HAD superfamily)